MPGSASCARRISSATGSVGAATLAGATCGMTSKSDASTCISLPPNTRYWKGASSTRPSVSTAPDQAKITWEGQREHADHVVRVLPQALEVAAHAQREQVLQQHRRVGHHAGHQRQPVQHAHHAEQVGAEGARQACGEVQVVEEIDEAHPLRQLLQGAVFVEPVLEGLPPAGRLMEHARHRAVVAGQHQEHRIARVRMLALHGVHQGLRAGQRLRRVRLFGIGHRRARRPVVQVVGEDAEGAGIEGDEQRHPGQQPGPGMQRQEAAQGRGLHAGSSAAQPSALAAYSAA